MPVSASRSAVTGGPRSPQGELGESGTERRGWSRRRARSRPIQRHWAVGRTIDPKSTPDSIAHPKATRQFQPSSANPARLRHPATRHRERGRRLPSRPHHRSDSPTPSHREYRIYGQVPRLDRVGQRLPSLSLWPRAGTAPAWSAPSLVAVEPWVSPSSSVLSWRTSRGPDFLCRGQSIDGSIRPYVYGGLPTPLYSLQPARRPVPASFPCVARTEIALRCSPDLELPYLTDPGVRSSGDDHAERPVGQQRLAVPAVGEQTTRSVTPGDRAQDRAIPIQLRPRGTGPRRDPSSHRRTSRPPFKPRRSPPSNTPLPP